MVLTIKSCVGLCVYTVALCLLSEHLFLFTNCFFTILHFSDDLSEDRLKKLWLESHPQKPVDQSDSGTESHDIPQVDLVQETTGSANSVTGEEREVGEVGGEGRGAAGDVEEEQGVGDGETHQAEEGEKEEEGGEGEGERAEEEKERVEAVNGEPETETEAEEADVMAGFSEEPFVRAAEQFRRLELPGILQLLTQAINEGI